MTNAKNYGRQRTGMGTFSACSPLLLCRVPSRSVSFLLCLVQCVRTARQLFRFVGSSLRRRASLPICPERKDLPVHSGSPSISLRASTALSRRPMISRVATPQHCRQLLGVTSPFAISRQLWAEWHFVELSSWGFFDVFPGLRALAGLSS